MLPALLVIAGTLILGEVSPLSAQVEVACNIGSLPRQAANFKLRGARLLRLKRNEEALACFQEALKDNRAKQDPEVWNGFGVALARLNRPTEAIAAYNQAISIKNGVVIDRINRVGNSNRLTPGDYYIFWFNKGTALGDLRRYDDALAALDKAIRLRSSYGPAWFYRGVYLRLLGRNREAAAAYTKATALAPNLSYVLSYREQIADDDYLFWQGQGVGFTRIGRYREAKVAFQRSERVRLAQPNQENTRTSAEIENFQFYYAGVSFLDAGDRTQALAAFDRAVKVKPDFSEGWHARGNVLSSMGKHREAIASYDQALKYDPTLHNSWFERGLSFSRLRQPQLALSSYRKATEIASNFAEAWHNSGRIHYAARRFPEALRAFDQAIAGMPLRGGIEPYESLFGRSVTLFAMRRYAEARVAANETLKLKPGFRGAVDLLNRLARLR